MVENISRFHTLKAQGCWLFWDQGITLENMEKKFRWLFPLLAFLVPFIYLLWAPLNGHYYWSSDTSHLFYVLKRWIWSQVEQGHLPLWNEGLFGGIYQLASPAHEVFSPLTAPFYLAFRGYEAMLANLGFGIGIAGLGGYVLAREWKLQCPSALAFAWSFAFLGPFLSLVDRSPIFLGVALYPWLGWSLTRTVRQANWGSLVATGLFLSLLFHHGDWVAAAIFIVVIFGLAIWQLVGVKERGRVFIGIGLLATILIALLLAAVVLVPSMENLAATRRGGGFTLERSNYYSLHPLRLLTLGFPDLFGQVFNQSFWGGPLANAYAGSRFWFHSLYVGLFPLVIGVLSLWQSKRRISTWMLISGAIFFVLLSLGQYFPLHEFLHSHLSAYSKLRYPEKFILYAIVIWLFISLRHWLIVETEQKRGLSTWIWFVVGALHLLSALASVLLLPSYGELVANWEVLGAAAQNAASQLIRDRWVHLVLGGASLITFGLLRSTQVNFPHGCRQIILPLFILVEMLAFAPAHNTTESVQFQPSQRLTKAIRLDGHNRFRILRDGNLDRFGSRSFREVWAHNWGLLNGARYAFGYETIVPRRTEGLIGAETFRDLPTWSRILNLGYVLSTLNPREKNLKTYFDKGFVQPVGFAEDLNLVVLKIQREDQGVTFVSRGIRAKSAEEAFDLVKRRGDSSFPVVLEINEGRQIAGEVLPMVSDLSAADERQEGFNLTTQEYVSDQWTWQGESNEDGILVIRENFHPNWRATLDGVSVEIYLADYANSAVYWPKGVHTLQFRFEPPGWRWAWKLSALCFLFCLIILAVPHLRKAPFPGSIF